MSTHTHTHLEFTKLSVFFFYLGLMTCFLTFSVKSVLVASHRPLNANNDESVLCVASLPWSCAESDGRGARSWLMSSADRNWLLMTTHLMIHFLFGLR